MTILSFTRLPSARRLLATLSVLGVALGAVPLSYAQDIPTPTPPADGGEFEGAPDPTPDPEIISEPTSDGLDSDDDEQPISTDEPTEAVPELPAEESVVDSATNDDAATDADPTEDVAPTVIEGTVIEETVIEETADESPSMPTDTVAEPSMDEATEAETTSDDAAGDEAAPTNSPRGLW